MNCIVLRINCDETHENHICFKVILFSKYLCIEHNCHGYPLAYKDKKLISLKISTDRSYFWSTDSKTVLG